MIDSKGPVRNRFSVLAYCTASTLVSEHLLKLILAYAIGGLPHRMPPSDFKVVTFPETICTP